MRYTINLTDGHGIKTGKCTFHFTGSLSGQYSAEHLSDGETEVCLHFSNSLTVALGLHHQIVIAGAAELISEIDFDQCLGRRQKQASKERERK